MMPHRLPLVPSVLVMLVAGTGCSERANDEPKTEGPAVTSRTSRFEEVSDSVLAGELDVENRYSAAVIVVPNVPVSGERVKPCSGVLVGPRVVLTAGHCVCMHRRAAVNGDPRGTIIDASACAPGAIVKTVYYDAPTPGEGLGSRTRRYLQAKVQAHPELKLLLDAQGDVVSSNADLAVILLEIPVKAPPLPVPLTLVEVGMGESVIMVGHGQDEFYKVMSGERRAIGRRVTEAPQAGDARGFFEQPHRERYRGESGGPCLRETRQGLELVGISAQGLGKEPSFTSTYAHRDWLRAQIENAAQTGDLPHRGGP